MPFVPIDAIATRRPAPMSPPWTDGRPPSGADPQRFGSGHRASFLGCLVLSVGLLAGCGDDVANSSSAGQNPVAGMPDATGNPDPSSATPPAGMAKAPALLSRPCNATAEDPSTFCPVSR